MAKKRKQRFRKTVPETARGIGEKTIEEYRRLRKNALAKVRRIQQNHHANVRHQIDLPSIEDFTSKKDFNKWKKEIERFTDRHNPDFKFVKNKKGVSVSLSRLEEIKDLNKQAIERAEAKLKEAENKPYYVAGKLQGIRKEVLPRMKNRPAGGIYIPQKFDFDKVENLTDLIYLEKNYREKANEEFYNEREELMKDNFIELISDAFHSDADDLIRRLEMIPTDDFYELFLILDEFDFDEYYNVEGDPHGTPRKLAKLTSEVNRYEQGLIDMSLKGFPNK